MLYEVITEFIQMTSQLGQLTAEMLSAMSIEQTAEILSTHLPQVGRITSYNVCYTKLLRKINGIIVRCWIFSRSPPIKDLVNNHHSQTIASI